MNTRYKIEPQAANGNLGVIFRVTNKSLFF